jgi:hypothetical protein
MLESLGRTLVWIGGGLFALGLLLLVANRVPGLGRLPGDIVIKREHITVYIPLATMVVVSLLLTLLLNLVLRLRK